MTLPSIAEFYASKSVVITGATGFLGKTLVEKILRDCPNVEMLYVLVRPAKDKTPSQRVEELVQQEIFDVLRSTNPSFDRQIKAVPADLSQPNMAITDEALLEEMRKSVSIILHCAATVNFNEKLNLSLQTNVVSVQNLLRFARTLAHVEAIVHVSTAYAHCDRQHIEETFYPPTVDPEALIQAVGSMAPELVAQVTKALVGKRPNTYTFTKSIAEAVLKEEGKGLPVAVVRPSIVGSVHRGPLPGWTDNLNGPGGFYLAAAHRVLRVMAGNPEGVFDVVPVDHCVNMIVAVSWKLGVLRPSATMVFNCTSGFSNPIKLGLHNQIVCNAIDLAPLQRSPFFSKTWVPLCSLSQYQNIWNPLLHQLPGEAIDLYRRLIGKKPMMRRLYQKLNNSVAAYAFFSSNAWRWDGQNSLTLMQELCEQDRITFNLDLSDLNWELYLRRYYEGCKRFIKTTADKPAPPKADMASVPSSESLISSPSSASLMTSSSAVNLAAKIPLSKRTVPIAACFTSTIAILLIAMLVIFVYDLLVEALSAALGGSLRNNTASPAAAVADAVVNTLISNSDSN